MNSISNRISVRKVGFSLCEHLLVILPMLLDSESRRVVGDKQSLLEDRKKASIDRWTPVVEGEPLLFHDVVSNLLK